MHRPSLLRVPFRVSVGLVFGLLTACGDDETETITQGGEDIGDCTAMLIKGQLVITEIMPDPAGADASGFEWFEVHNPTDIDLPLQGLGLEYSKVDGTDGKGHLIKDETLTIAPGAYMVFGKATADTLPAHVTYGYGADLGSMSNGDGKLRLVCGKVTIDEALYGDVKDGYTRSLGKKPPDAQANDDLGGWCLASETYNAAEYGSPGAENPDCPLPVPPCGQCYDGELLRATRVPQPGDLVISEVMANASTLTDSEVGEWFEVHANADVDLNCLQFGGNTTKFLADKTKPEATLTAPQCLAVAAGSDSVFAEQIAWPGADFESKITLVDSIGTNPNPGVYIAYDGEILDEVHYVKAKDGVAWSLDPDALSTAGNDDAINWCDATGMFAAGDLGSPGDPNPQCPEATKPGTCVDSNGLPRDIDYAAPGELLITEFLADPGLGDGTLGEWVELYVGADLDLNGLVIGKTIDNLQITISDVACRPIRADNYVLIAKTDDPAGNGGLPTPDWSNPKLSLTNDNSTMVVGVDNQKTMSVTELDAIAWKTTADGVARQFPVELLEPIDATSNDDPTLWCDATAPFGVGDLGTPQAENGSCGPVVEEDTCIDPVTMMPREIVHPVAGDLLITEIHPDPTAAADTAGEWFELHTAAAFDLNGLDLGSVFPTKKHTIVSAACLPVAADSEVLLAIKGKPTDPPAPNDPGGNGGLPTPDYEYTGLSLTNAGGSLYVGIGDLELDSVTYTKANAGKAHQLGTGAECLGGAPLDAACNDDFAGWCPATSVYGLGDAGTPRAPNLACGGGNMDPMCLDPVSQMMRPLVAPQPGDLVINEFMADPSAVTDANGEWFELRVVNPVDLNDLKIVNKANADVAALAPLLVSGECLRAEAGSFVLFAHQSDPAVNGGLPAVDHVVATTLGNAAGGLTVGHGATLLHSVAWTVAQKPGKSSLLDPDGVADPMNVSADGPPWCVAPDAGTPKLENPQCP